MGTVSKALGLLDFLHASESPLGLTELARLSNFDKATTRRLLLELSQNGFVEQDPETRAYALGPALQHLGRAREDRFPLYRAVTPAVKALAEETGETVHATEYVAGRLASIVTVESVHAHRVSLEPGLKLPLHATASGFAFLAASPRAFIERALSGPLTGFTGMTPKSREEVEAIIRFTRERGFSVSDQSMEDGVYSMAAAIVGPQARAIGTIAIAMPVSRATPETTERYGRMVSDAARDISRRLFGARSHLREVS